MLVDFVRLDMYNGRSLWNHQYTIVLEPCNILAKEIKEKSKEDSLVGAIAAA